MPTEDWSNMCRRNVSPKSYLRREQGLAVTSKSRFSVKLTLLSTRIGGKYPCGEHWLGRGSYRPDEYEALHGR